MNHLPLSCLLVSLLSLRLAAQFVPAEAPELSAEELIVGHGDHRYRIDRDWAKVPEGTAAVINSHAMTQGKDGNYYLVTDHPDHAILVFRPDGTFEKAIGKGLKGGHGIAMLPTAGGELIVHVDCGWTMSVDGSAKRGNGSVNLLSKDGSLVRTLPSPHELGLLDKSKLYQPCDAAVTPDGEILVIDGYASSRIFHYTAEGKLVRHWGGHHPGKPETIATGHGISLDLADPENPVVWVSSRAENKLKLFTLEGKFLESVHLPGSFAGQAVIQGDKVYLGVCWSDSEDKGRRQPNSGYVVVLDRASKRVISAPGANEPHYHEEALVPLKKTTKAFKHVHDVFVDAGGNIFVMEWNAGCRLPYKLSLLK